MSETRRGPRRTLTNEQLLDAAFALLDEGGPGAASVRGIAGRLGVAPNAVYTYFPDKAALEKAVVERVFGEIEAADHPEAHRPWRERLEALALAVRDVLTAHPGAVPLVIGGPIDGLHALTLGERLLELFDEAGLTPQDAAHASYLLIVYTFGSMALEVADVGHPGALPPERERVEKRQGLFAMTPAEVFPRSAAVAPTMAGYVSTEQYLWGLRALIAGVTGG